MKAIIAINKAGYIGLDGKLPWLFNQEDMAHFRTITNQHPDMIAGRKTAESMQHINLGKRTMTVFTRADGRCWELFASCSGGIVVGGAEAYRFFAPWIKKWYVSIMDDYTEGDTRFDLKYLLQLAARHKATVEIKYF